MRTKSILTVLAVAALLAAAAPAVRAQDAEFERTLSVTGPVDLSVETRSGSITVTAGPTGSVHVRAEIRRNRGWSGMKASDADVQAIVENPPIAQAGNSITISRVDSDLKLSISYEITVPAATKVRASSGSGSVEVTGVSGPVQGGTGSGSIAVSDVSGGAQLSTGSGSIKATSVGGDFTATTGSGSIGATLIDSSAVELKTGSGSIKASGINGSLVAETGSGSIRLQGAPKGDWDVTTGSGGITIDFPDGADFNLKARAGSGSISTDFPITIQGKISRHKLEGKVGDGGPMVMLHSGSGSIRIGTDSI